jgi:prepilin-type N-terminal cleavage/methylation domain-containing protein
MKSKSNRGFTLIELLVVVAIIGILSSIVLVSLNSARSKGRDASAKGSLSSMRATAEIFFDTYSFYGPTGSAGQIGDADNLLAGLSPTDTLVNATSICDYIEIVRLADAVHAQTRNPVECEPDDANANGASYTLSALLNDGRTYCIDSTGYAGYNDTDDGTAVNAGISCR